MITTALAMDPWLIATCPGAILTCGGGPTNAFAAFAGARPDPMRNSAKPMNRIAAVIFGGRAARPVLT